MRLRPAEDYRPKRNQPRQQHIAQPLLPSTSVAVSSLSLRAIGLYVTDASPLDTVLKSNSIIHLFISTLPHQMALRLSTPPFSSFSNTPRFLTRTILTQQQQQPLHHHIRPSTRSFSTSPPNMAIKTYFDVSWHGPVLDANSRPTKEVKGEITLLHPRLLPAIERNPSKLQHSPY